MPVSPMIGDTELDHFLFFKFIYLGGGEEGQREREREREGENPKQALPCQRRA